MKEDDAERFSEYVEFSENKFNKAKGEFDSTRKTAVKTVINSDKEYQESLGSSLSETISYFKKEYPRFNEVQMKDIGKTLEGGSNAILSMFYDSKGLLKKEAAEAIALVKYGKSKIAKEVKRATNKAISKTNEEVISRAKDQPGITDKPASETSQDASQEEVNIWMKNVIGNKDEITFD
jgi:hypothetical protein